MSVATEYPPTVFVDVSPRSGTRAAAPAIGNQARLRLVPPTPACPPGAGRTGVVRRGNLRVVRRGYLVPVGAGCATPALTGDRIGDAAPGARPVRLTRRGAVALALGVVLLGSLMLLVAHLSLGSPAAGPASAPGAVVTVQSGDTLWSIAGQVAPGRDPRQVVERLREVNHLSSTSLTPGQTLKVG
ncbi:LysM peptidoglycan-binding domain-containing protein [Jatrophihabitans sp.]|uniref:LysM peptidoglycan-binding domain-containing protein n=1 Tax=Jatrophihabitans sp. TaxID=1932789 RepID=UPI002C36F10B|nr:LysM peptidoglycan-binding domain-containing protein [Jatrophihabitans sp.]